MSMGPLKFEFKRPALSVSGEAGSLSELVGALQDEGNTLVKMFGSNMELLVTGLGETTAIASGVVGTGETAAVPVETEAQRKKREKQEAKAASEAKRTETAPPAASVPAAIPAGLYPLISSRFSDVQLHIVVQSRRSRPGKMESSL